MTGEGPEDDVWAQHFGPDPAPSTPPTATPTPMESAEEWDADWEAGEWVEYDDSPPPVGEWAAAIAGLLLVVGLFGAWLLYGNNSSSDSAASATIPGAVEPLVSGTVQVPEDAGSAPTTTTTQPTSTTASSLLPEELEPIVTAQVESEQRCGVAGPPNSVEVASLPGQLLIAVVTCEPGRSRLFEVLDTGDAVLITPVLVELYDRSGRVVEEAGDLRGDLAIDDVGNLSLISVDRETADCGIRHDTEWNGARFELRQASGRLDCEPDPVFAGAVWPVVFPAIERGACVPGESTLGDGSVGAFRSLDIDGDGATDIFSLVQRGDALFVREALANGEVYQSGFSGVAAPSDGTLGFRDLDGDGVAEAFVTFEGGTGRRDVLLARSGCGWVIAGELTVTADQIIQTSYHCVPGAGAVEVIVTSSSAIPGTDPERFLITSERFRLVDGQLALQSVGTADSDSPLPTDTGGACI